jgi:hypothetical protein
VDGARSAPVMRGAAGAAADAGGGFHRLSVVLFLRHVKTLFLVPSRHETGPCDRHARRKPRYRRVCKIGCEAPNRRAASARFCARRPAHAMHRCHVVGDRGIVGCAKSVARRQGQQRAQNRPDADARLRHRAGRFCTPYEERRIRLCLSYPSRLIISYRSRLIGCALKIPSCIVTLSETAEAQP